MINHNQKHTTTAIAIVLLHSMLPTPLGGAAWIRKKMSSARSVGHHDDPEADRRSVHSAGSVQSAPSSNPCAHETKLAARFKAGISGLFSLSTSAQEAQTDLFDAISESHIGKIQQAVRDSADINKPNESGLTPLHMACSLGKVGVISVLVLQLNANVDVTDENGETPLHIACLLGSLPIANLLITAKTNTVSGYKSNQKLQKFINAPDSQKNTPLHIACNTETPCEELIEHLIMMGAAVDAKNTVGETPRALLSARGLTGLISTIEFRLQQHLLAEGHEEEEEHEYGIFAQAQAAASSFGDMVSDVALVSSKLLGPTAEDLAAANRVLDEHDNRPLHHACANPTTATRKELKTLLRCGALVNQQNDQGATPLHVACANNFVEAIKILLNHKDIDPNSADHTGKTPLTVAYQQKNIDIFNRLLLHPRIDATIPCRRGTTVSAILHAACTKGDIPFIIALLQHTTPEGSRSIDPNVPDNNDITLLQGAYAHNMVDVVCVLIEHGAIPSAVGVDHKNMLINACTYGSAEMVGQLLRLLPDPLLGNPDATTLLHVACQANNIPVVQRLLESKTLVCKADPFISRYPNVQTSDLTTPLHIACQNDNSELASILLAAGADANAIDTTGYTPLHYACAKNNTMLALMLLNFGALPYSTDPSHMHFNPTTPLHIACKNTQVSLGLVKCLAHAVCINTQDQSINTPLHYVTLNGRLDLLEQLLTSGALPNTTNQDKQSSLHIACAYGHYPLVELLLTQPGILLNETDNFDRTPLVMACINNHTAIVRLLLTHRAQITPLVKTVVQHPRTCAEIKELIPLSFMDKARSRFKFKF